MVIKQKVFVKERKNNIAGLVYPLTPVSSHQFLFLPIVDCQLAYLDAKVYKITKIFYN